MTLREIIEEKEFWESRPTEVFGDNTIATIISACKWAITSDQYKTLTKDAKTIGLAYYNSLTPAQRAAIKLSVRVIG